MSEGGAGVDAAARPAAVGARPVRRRASRRSRSSTRRASRSASRRSSGRHWALLPSAAGVIDPLLSTGFPLTLLGIGRLADLPRADVGRRRSRRRARTTYARQTQAELDATEQLVAALYATMADFEAVQAADAAVFRGGELLGGGAAARAPRAGAGLPAARATAAFGPALRRCVASVLDDARRVRGSPRRAHAPVRRRSIAPSSRSTSPACATAAGATGIRCSPPISSPARRSWAPRPGRSTCCSRAAASRRGADGSAASAARPA